MKFKSLLVFVLICALALPFFCACGDDTGDTSSSTSAATDSNAEGTVSDETSKDTDIRPDVIDLGGREINVLCWDWTAGSKSIFGYTGEILYKNSDEDNHSSVDVKKKEVIDYVESNYNCTIGGELVNNSTFVSDIEAMVTASTYDYDIVFANTLYAAQLLSKNLLSDLSDISTIHLENSWWDQNAVNDMSIGDRVFWTCGDINTYDNLGTWCVLFNKNLKTNLGIEEDFYQMAKDGTWTWDNFMEICKGVTTEITGDNTIDEFDQWALGTETYNIYVQVVGAGIRICEKDEEDLPYFTIDTQTEQTYNALESIVNFYNGNEVMCANGGKYDNKGYSNVWESTVHKAFIEGRELFYMCGLINVAGFRSMDDEFGILPIPKTFAEQDRYYHTVSTSNSSYMMIPYGAPDIEDLGVVIEAIAMKSKEIVTPEFYENQLKYRDARDDESAAMLDLIFSTRAFDLGPVFSWGNILNCYTAMDTNYASRFDSTLDAATLAMEDSIELILSYN